MTKMEFRIFEYIDWTCRKQGRVPSMREIAMQVGLHSGSSISYHISKMKRNGILDEEGRPSVRQG